MSNVNRRMSVIGGNSESILSQSSIPILWNLRFSMEFCLEISANRVAHPGSGIVSPARAVGDRPTWSTQCQQDR